MKLQISCTCWHRSMPACSICIVSVIAVSCFEELRLQQGNKLRNLINLPLAIQVAGFKKYSHAIIKRSRRFFLPNICHLDEQSACGKNWELLTGWDFCIRGNTSLSCALNETLSRVVLEYGGMFQPTRILALPTALGLKTEIGAV